MVDATRSEYEYRFAEYEYEQKCNRIPVASGAELFGLVLLGKAAASIADAAAVDGVATLVLPIGADRLGVLRLPDVRSQRMPVGTPCQNAVENVFQVSMLDPEIWTTG